MRQNLEDLLIQGKTKQVINKLLEYTKSTENTDIHQEIIKISARYKEYEKQRMGNLTSNENLNISLNQIQDTLLTIIQKTFSDNPEITDAAINSTKPKFDLWKVLGSVAIIIGIIAGIAEFSGYSLRDIMTKPSTETPSNTNPDEQEPTQNTDKAKPANPAQQDINISTEGEQSPAIHSDGDVDINYGNSKPAKKDTKEPAETKEQSPPPTGGLNIKTKGDQSPAIKGENVTISYGLEDEPEPTKKDTSDNQ